MEEAENQSISIEELRALISNKLLLSALLESPANEVSNQSTFILLLEVLVLNKLMLSVALANKSPNQPLLVMQPEILALFE